METTLYKSLTEFATSHVPLSRGRKLLFGIFFRASSKESPSELTVYDTHAKNVICRIFECDYGKKVCFQIVDDSRIFDVRFINDILNRLGLSSAHVQRSSVGNFEVFSKQGSTPNCSAYRLQDLELRYDNVLSAPFHSAISPFPQIKLIIDQQKRNELNRLLKTVRRGFVIKAKLGVEYKMDFTLYMNLCRLLSQAYLKVTNNPPIFMMAKGDYICVDKLVVCEAFVEAMKEAEKDKTNLSYATVLSLAEAGHSSRYSNPLSKLTRFAADFATGTKSIDSLAALKTRVPGKFLHCAGFYKNSPNQQHLITKVSQIHCDSDFVFKAPAPYTLPPEAFENEQTFCSYLCITPEDIADVGGGFIDPIAMNNSDRYGKFSYPRWFNPPFSLKLYKGRNIRERFDTSLNSFRPIMRKVYGADKVELVPF